MPGCPPGSGRRSQAGSPRVGMGRVSQAGHGWAGGDREMEAGRLLVLLDWDVGRVRSSQADHGCVGRDGRVEGWLPLVCGWGMSREAGQWVAGANLSLGL